MRTFTSRALSLLLASAAAAIQPYENVYHTANFTPVALNVSICSSSFSAPHPLILATPYGTGVSSPGPTIYDASGAVVWHAPEYGEAHDLNVHTLRGERVLAFWTGTEIKTGWVNGTVVILDSAYQVVQTVVADAPYRADFHEFQIIPASANANANASAGAGESALLTSYNRIPADLSAIGGPADGYVLDSLVQIVALSGADAGAVRFNWSAWDHLPLDETYALPGTRGNGTLESPLDVAHVNAVDFSADGRSLLVSSRHFQQLLKVDRATGEVVWRMGGMRSDFALGPGAAFHFQHHARWHDAGRAISVFDNGASDWEVDEPSARGIYLAVDEEARTATLVREWAPLYQAVTKMMGDVQILGDLAEGAAWVDFGTNPWMMEQSAPGETVFWATMGPDDPDEANGPIASDRVFKTTEWVGRPADPPVLAIVNGTDGMVQVYVSWNGATEVAEYALLVGESPDSMETAARTAKVRFESGFVLAQPSPSYVVVVGMAQDGSTLGTSATYRVADGSQVQAGSVSS